MVDQERCADIDRILATDPGGVYLRSTEPTRRLIRRAVYQVARHRGGDPVEVATTAVRLCAPDGGHVGEVLLGSRRDELERLIGHRTPWSARLTRIAVRRRGTLYVGAILGIAAVLLTALALTALAAGVTAGVVAVGAVLAVPPTILFAQQLSYVLTCVVLPGPDPVPALELGPDAFLEHPTVVIYPAILHHPDDVAELVSTMADNHAPDTPGLPHVALVDFSDAAVAEQPLDAQLTERLSTALARLNARTAGRPFLFLVRERRWNPCERVWMGWERKRGKLAEFGDLLAGEPTSYRPDPTVLARLAWTRYAVVLDIGTRLAPGGVRRLVGALAHPLNRPVVDPTTRAVTRGYGVLRPEHLPATAHTTFQRAAYQVASTETAPSLQQQLLGQDHFLGQGGYDIAVFRTALAGRVPENTVLSHDKLEGMHVRAACVPDVTTAEENPTDYLAHRARYHRWVRGDVQLLRWLLPTRQGRAVPFGALRWTFVEDLMYHWRFVSAVALLLLVWFAVPDGARGPALLVLGVLVAETCTVLPLLALVRRVLSTAPPEPGEWWRRLAGRCRGALRVVRVESGRWALMLVFLADLAALVSDATVRALYRSWVSHRGALRWTSSAASNRAAAGHGRANRWRNLAAGPVLAVTVAVVALAVKPVALPWAAPVLLLWAVSPAVAGWSARPPVSTAADRPQAAGQYTPVATTSRVMESTAGSRR